MLTTLLRSAAAALVAIASAHGAGVETAPAQVEGNGQTYVADGYVEAVRQSVIASQVPGRVTALAVKAGDAVRAGQVLARIDERAAAQQVAASEAQVGAAQAQLEAARREYERSQRLREKQYISQAAMDQAEAQFKASRAQAQAMMAQARAATTQTSFHTLSSPYSGIVATVATEVGDMAVPGKALITVYDPTALRAVAAVPERYAATLKAGSAAKLEFPGAPENQRWVTPQSVTVLPTYDPASHTVQVRLNLPPNAAKVAPGTFVRAHLPVADGGAGALTIPLKAVVKRSEVTAVYVADAQGRFSLRQVRLGRVAGERVVVLSGLTAGERVALDPIAASRQ